MAIAGCGGAPSSRFHDSLQESGDSSDDSGETGVEPKADADLDGFPTDVDCDDGDAAIHPGADEHCDQVDEDCDGTTDEDPVDGSYWYIDADEDDYGALEGVIACAPPTEVFVMATGDCDDSSPDTHPTAPEICDDGHDNDCVLGGTDECRMTGATVGGDDLHVVVPTPYDPIASSGLHAGTVAGVGDIDGDGNKDLLVGVQVRDPDEHGVVLICGGPLSKLASLGECGTTIASTSSERGFDTIAAVGPGDIDGDGYEDIAVADAGSSSDGSGIYVFHGPLEGGLTTDDADFAFDGAAGDSFLGTSLASGPVLDGVSTLVAGQPWTNRAVYLLDPSMLAPDDVVTVDPGNSSTYKSILYGSDERTGEAVYDMGDVDGDGTNDIGVYVGGAADPGGFIVLSPPPSELDLADANASFHDSDGYLTLLTSAGDTNGDGYADVAIQGAPTGDGPLFVVALGPVTGAMDVRHSSFAATLDWYLPEFGWHDAAVLAAAGTDLDGDTLSDLATIRSSSGHGGTMQVQVSYGPLSGTIGEPDLILLTDETTNTPGPLHTLAPLGDVDGDAHGEIAFQGEPAGDDDPGNAYVLYGRGI